MTLVSSAICLPRLWPHDMCNEDSHPNQRSALLEAETKLLRFILLLDEQDCEDEEQ